jgi:membrane protein YqaA with SNARE-associated domain
MKEEALKVPAWKIHRRMYNWVLAWADSPYSLWALFIIAFIESSFFPIPPDVLLVALVLGCSSRWIKIAAVCTAGSALGGVFGYGIGYVAMESIGRQVIAFYHAEEYFAKVTGWYGTYDYWVVFVAAFTPIPYKVFTIASGAFHMNLPGFFLISVIGRGMRFFLVAAILAYCGEGMKRFIEKYFDLLTLAAGALLILGFLAISYL